MRNKYRVAPTEQRRFAGRTYGSKAERMYAEELHSCRLSGGIADIVEQPRCWLGVPENVYVPDFLVIPAEVLGGIPYYVDVKGRETQKFRRDKKLWSSYGWLDLHIVKRVGNKFNTTEIIHGRCSLRNTSS